MDIKFPFMGNRYGIGDLGELIKILDGSYGNKWKPVKDFEGAFAEYSGSRYAVACSNGTTALHLALKCLNLNFGDEVLTTPLTWVATSNMILMEGANPVFVDIEPKTLNMDVGLIEGNITEKTRAIMPVYLAGNPLQMDKVMEIAKKHNLAVIADAAQAVGSKYLGKPVGSKDFADLSCFSFHTQKNMSTLGEGGMVTTDNMDYLKTMQLFRNHGVEYADMDSGSSKQPWYRDCIVVGHNFRMSEGQAAVGLSQLLNVDRFNLERTNLISFYNSSLAGVTGLTLPKVTRGANSAWHLYIVQVEKEFGMSRDDLYLKLLDMGVQTNVHYTPTYFFKPYQDRGYKRGICPVAEAAYEKILSLPLAPSVTYEDISRVAQAMHDIQGKS